MTKCWPSKEEIYTQFDREREWHVRFLRLAQEVSTWSKDPSTKIGAVLVDAQRRVVGMGFNGFPRGVRDYDDRYANRDEKYPRVVHAEVNACIAAGHQARGATLYVWPTLGFPPVCNECAKVVIQSGVTKIVGYKAPPPTEAAARWARQIEIAGEMFREAGVELHEVDERPLMEIAREQDLIP